jgi:TolB protein
MAADGRGARRLTWSPGRDAHPRYFPSGRRLAFQSPRDYAGPREVDLYTMDADGSRQRRLVAAPGFDGVAIPSPGGARIAFQRGRTVRRVTQGMSVRSQASWTQDGRRIAFSAYGTGVDEVYVVNADGTGLVRLTKGTEGMRGD